MNSSLKQVLLALIASTAIFCLILLQVDLHGLQDILPNNAIAMMKRLPINIPVVSFDTMGQQKAQVFKKCSVRSNKSLNCQKKFATVTEIHHKLPKKKQGVSPVRTECSLEELVTNCSKLRFEHGYDDKPVSEDEKRFPLAFGIKMHANSHQVERLLRTAYRPHNFYSIHVDSKATDETYNLIKSVADCFENVEVLTERINVVYASYRIMESEFACMKCCMRSDIKWKYYINLSGQEFMLRTNLEIVKILELFNGTNDIESDVFWIRWRHRYIYEIKENRLVNTRVKYAPFKNNITIYKGSAYGMFSRDFVEFALTDNVVKPIYDWLKKTHAPEECIWATLNLLPFAPGGYKNFFTNHGKNTHPSKAINWSWDHPKVRCHGRFVRNVCIFAEGDLPWLRSRPEVSVNKFHEDYDFVVLSCLEEWLNNRTYSSSIEVDWDYYKNLPQVKYARLLEPHEKTKLYWKKEKEEWLKENKIIWE